MKKIIVLILTVATVILMSGCTHKNVEVYKTTDNRLTCDEILVEMSEIKTIKQDIDEKTGMSGRNIGMGLIFWPGIIVNQMNAGDARKLANSRMDRLVTLADAKNCDISITKNYSGEVELPKDKVSENVTIDNSKVKEN